MTQEKRTIIEKRTTINEAKSIFTDASNYSEDELICYYKLVNAIFDYSSKVENKTICLAKLIETLNKLPDVDQTILKFYFGLDGYIMLTLQQIAKYISPSKEYTRERVRQLKVIAIKKLIINSANFYIDDLLDSEKNASNSDLFQSISVLDLRFNLLYILSKYGITTIKKLFDLDFKTLLEITKVEKLSYYQYNEISKKIYYLKNSFKTKLPLLEQDINELGLSRRSFNFLYRNNIRTIGELVELTEDDIMSIKKLGITSYNDIIEKLSLFGLSLKSDS